MTISRTDIRSDSEAILLEPSATANEVRELIGVSASLGLSTIRVAPSLLHATAAAEDQGIKVATVVGFPSGQHHPLVKAAEARLAVQFGVSEVAVVPDGASISNGDMNSLLSELVTIQEAITEHIELTVVLDAGVWGIEKLAPAAEMAAKAGVRNIKISTGWNCPGFESVPAEKVVEQLRSVLPAGVGIIGPGPDTKMLQGIRGEWTLEQLRDASES